MFGGDSRVTEVVLLRKLVGNEVKKMFARFYQTMKESNIISIIAHHSINRNRDISAKYPFLTQPYFYLIFPQQNNLSSH
jgi:hypothetical protein